MIGCGFVHRDEMNGERFAMVASFVLIKKGLGYKIIGPINLTKPDTVSGYRNPVLPDSPLPNQSLASIALLYKF